MALSLHCGGAFFVLKFSYGGKAVYIKHNPNPKGQYVGDCVIRAISTATGITWEEAYINLAVQGYLMSDMPSSNHVWSSYLMDNGFTRHVIPDTCPDCYTVKDFCKDNPKGTFILATGTHVVAVIDGSYCDAWDSGGEVPVYYFKKR